MPGGEVFVVIEGVPSMSMAARRESAPTWRAQGSVGGRHVSIARPQDQISDCDEARATSRCLVRYVHGHPERSDPLSLPFSEEARRGRTGTTTQRPFSTHLPLGGPSPRRRTRTQRGDRTERRRTWQEAHPASMPSRDALTACLTTYVSSANSGR